MGDHKGGGGRGAGRISAGQAVGVPMTILNAVKLNMETRTATIFRFFADYLDTSSLKPSKWTTAQKSDFLDTVMTKLPTPAIYASVNDQGKMVPIDGNERLQALKQFMDNKYRLENPGYWAEHNGKTFSELPRSMQRRIEETNLTIHAVNRGSGAVELADLKRKLGKSE